jgi:hypothetical protein
LNFSKLFDTHCSIVNPEHRSATNSLLCRKLNDSAQTPITTTIKKRGRDDDDSVSPHEGRAMKNKVESELVALMSSVVTALKASSAVTMDLKYKAETLTAQESRYISLSREIQTHEAVAQDCKVKQKKLLRAKEKLDLELLTLRSNSSDSDATSKVEEADEKLCDIALELEALASKAAHAESLVKFCQERLPSAVGAVSLAAAEH